jgi:hypothetical protein
MRIWPVVFAMAALGCRGPRAARPGPAGATPPADAGPSPAAPPDATAPVAVVPIDLRPPCREPLARLAGAVRGLRYAMDPTPHHRTIDQVWPTVPPACRGATFYLVAAEVMGPHETWRTADGLAVTGPADALGRALAAEPDSPALLERLAAGGPPGAPPVPADACARVRARVAAWPAPAADDPLAGFLRRDETAAAARLCRPPGGAAD